MSPKHYKPPWRAGRYVSFPREQDDAARPATRRAPRPRRPSRGPRHCAFLWERACVFSLALAHIQRELRALPEAQARALATRTIRTILANASRKHFPYRRDYGYEAHTAPWYLVLFHGADPLPLLRDRSPFINAQTLVAAQHGVPIALVLGSPGYRGRGRRGPDPLRSPRSFTCDHCGSSCAGPVRPILVCLECVRRLQEAGLLRPRNAPTTFRPPLPASPESTGS